MPPKNEKTQKIRNLNDIFRRTGAGGRVYMTPSIQALPIEKQIDLFSRIRTFDTFTVENDPYGEHDFASLPIGDEKAYFKIDYYNKDMSAGSEDPSDTKQTTRVMTVMLSHEY
ncbi:DUF3768 domain-containing protein [Puniceicoccaceae bacterium K14]|nr:DUF3768 domain-containing protein [Puniceicoccaceae bacterium K14]